MIKFMAVFLFSITVYSAETEIGKIALWAEENYQIAESLAPISTNFRLTANEAERLDAYANYQDEYRQIVNSDSKVSLYETKEDKISTKNIDCLNKLFLEAEKDRAALKEAAKKRLTTIAVYARFGAADLQQVLSKKSTVNYTNFMRNNNKHWGSDYKFIVDYYLSYRPELAKKWEELPKDQKIAHMRKYLQDRLEVTVPESLILREQTILDTLNNPKNWRENFSSLKDKLSYSEKLELISDIGGKMLINYNNDRAAANNGGIVSTDEMFSAMQSESPGGVCRDVVAAQAQIALALGVSKENIYRIAYMAASDSHQTLAIVDPDNPKKLYKINYDEVQVDDKNQGVAQLKQNNSMPVTGISYKIYDAEGEPVLQTPTELGKMLREASGFNDRNDISRTYNINKISANTKIGTTSIVSGNLSDGTKVIAATLNGNGMGIDYGVSAYKSDGETEELEISSMGLYGYMKVNPKLTYQATDRISVSANAEVLNEIQIFKATTLNKETGVEKEADPLADVASTITPGAEVSYDGDTVDGYFRVEAETALINKNAQEQQEGFKGFGSKGLVTNSVNYKSGISYKVSEDLDVAIDAALYTRNVGDYYIVSGLVKGKSYQVEARHQAPISKDAPSFMPGSYAVSEFSGSKSWKAEDGTGPSITFGYTTDELAGGRYNLGGSWSFY